MHQAERHLALAHLHAVDKHGKVIDQGTYDDQHTHQREIDDIAEGDASLTAVAEVFGVAQFCQRGQRQALNSGVARLGRMNQFMRQGGSHLVLQPGDIRSFLQLQHNGPQVIPPVVSSAAQFLHQREGIVRMAAVHPDDCSYLFLSVRLHVHLFAQRTFLAKPLPGSFFGNGYLVGMSLHEVEATVHQLRIEQLYPGTVCRRHVDFPFHSVHLNPFACNPEIGGRLHFGIMLRQVGSHRHRKTFGHLSGLVAVVHPGHIEAVGIAAEAVVCHLVVYPEGRQRKTDESGCQSQNTDGGLHAVFQQVAPGYFQIVQHHILFLFSRYYSLFTTSAGFSLAARHTRQPMQRATSSAMPRKMTA